MNEWILVEDELPEECGKGVLLTIENIYKQRRVTSGFTGYMEDGRLNFHTNEKTVDLKVWKIIAWKPLPEPYEDEKIPTPRSRDDLIDNLQKANIYLMIINEDIRYSKLSKQHREWLGAAQQITHLILTDFMKQDLEKIISEMTEEEKKERGIRNA